MNSQNQTTASQLVVFLLGGEEYALPISSVQEVIRFQQPRAVSSTDPSLLGVINLRGRIVPVHDVRPQLDVARPSATQSIKGAEKIVLVHVDEQMAGVVVDDVSEVLNVDQQQFEDLPAAGNPVVEGVVKVGERLIVMLDARALAVSPDDEEVELAG